MTTLPPGIEERYGMDEEARRIAGLIAGFLRGTLSPEEHRELEHWVEASDRHMQLFEDLTDEAPGPYVPFSTGDGSLSGAPSKGKQGALLRRFAGAAAVVLILWLAAARWFLPTPSTTRHSPDASARYTPAADPLLHPLLTLDNGTAILLRSERDTSFLLRSAGRLSCGPQGLFYPLSAPPLSGAAEHALSTPRRQTFRVLLSDGTRVWLNSTSRLRYPAHFSGSTREVRLRGEAYFEVAPDSIHPFIVHAGEVALRVLGTSFNVEAYAGEVSTTLLEGHLRVSGAGNSVLLSPGEQLQVQPGGSWHRNARADIASALAWQSGLFVFREDSIRRVLTELSRWYGLTATECDAMPYRFTATIPRELPLDRVLAILELTGRVRFHHQGDTLRARAMDKP